MRQIDRRPEVVSRNRGGLYLVNTSGIRFNNIDITPQVLDSDRQGWGSTSLLTGTNNYRLDNDDEFLLRKAFCELTPLTIVGKPTGIFLPPALVLRAELRRFPYSVDGHEGYEAFGLRLSPEQGEIDRVIINSNPHGIRNEDVTNDRASFDVGDRVHVVIYTKKQDLEVFPPVGPPLGFERDVTTQFELGV